MKIIANCPICGSQPRQVRIHSDHQVECNSPSCPGPAWEMLPEELGLAADCWELAISRWNRAVCATEQQGRAAA